MLPEKAHRREDQLRRYFPEPWVDGFEPLIGAISNHPKDRHVIAAAVLLEPISSSPTTVGISQLSPCRHGRSKSSGHPRSCAGLFVSKLQEQAAAIGASLTRLLQSLGKNVPGFVEYFCKEQGIDLAAGQRGTSHFNR